MKLISDIVREEIIDKLDNVLEIVSVGTVAQGKQYVTFSCIKWLKLYDHAIVNGLNYSIDSINGNTVTFLITNVNVAITNNSVVLVKKPLLFNGTLSNTKLEWSKFDTKERNKLPFIWLVSPTDETDNAINSTTLNYQLKLWFVHWSDWNKLNADRQDEAIRPLKVLEKYFKEAIKNNASVFNSFTNQTTRDFPKFGTLGTNGIEKTIFDSTLSALEFDISLEIFKRYCLKC